MDRAQSARGSWGQEGPGLRLDRSDRGLHPPLCPAQLSAMVGVMLCVLGTRARRPRLGLYLVKKEKKRQGAGSWSPERKEGQVEVSWSMWEQVSAELSIP